MQNTLKQTGIWIATYLVALTIGSFGGLLFWIFYVLGLVRVKGYWKLVWRMRKGNLIIAPNHPTLLETIIIPTMFWPWGIFSPKRYFVWSVPDGALFPAWLNWLYEVSHSIKVDRSSSSNSAAGDKMTQVLSDGGTVVAHPEGGRTDSPFRGKTPPNKTHGRHRDRELRRITTSLNAIVRRSGADIAPVWVDAPFRKESNGFKRALLIWLRHRHTITLYIGDTYKPSDRPLIGRNRQLLKHLDNKELGARILRAGLEQEGK